MPIKFFSVVLWLLYASWWIVFVATPIESRAVVAILLFVIFGLCNVWRDAEEKVQRLEKEALKEKERLNIKRLESLTSNVQ